MKLFSVLLALSLVTGAARAADKSAQDNLPELTLVIVDTLVDQHGAITDYDRLDMAFQKVARQRHWPAKVVAERFAANTPEHDTEIRIFTRPLTQETPDRMTFRGWTTVTVAGKKHDLGIITYNYDIRAGEYAEDLLERLFDRAARTIADKVEPLLFPELKPAK